MTSSVQSEKNVGALRAPGGVMSEEVAEALPAALRGALAADGEALLEELQLLGQMPQVRLVPSSIFDRATPAGSKAQQRGVVIKLRCCKKPLDAKCNDKEDEQACPTHLAAARALRSKVTRWHGSEACREKANEALRSELAAGSSSAAEKAADAFAAWLARPRALMQAQREVWRAEATLAKLSKAEEDASAARRAGAALPLALAPMHCGRTLTTHGARRDF